jgi:hypothetical protein
MVTLVLLFRPSTTPLEISFLRPEVVEDEFAVLTQRAGDLLHRLNPGPHGLAAPFVEELAGPGGGVVVPELLEGFLEQVRADGLQVVAEQIAETEVLFVLEIVTPFE